MIFSLRNAFSWLELYFWCRQRVKLWVERKRGQAEPNSGALSIIAWRHFYDPVIALWRVDIPWQGVHMRSKSLAWEDWWKQHAESEKREMAKMSMDSAKVKWMWHICNNGKVHNIESKQITTTHKVNKFHKRHWVKDTRHQTIYCILFYLHWVYNRRLMHKVRHQDNGSFKGERTDGAGRKGSKLVAGFHFLTDTYWVFMTELLKHFKFHLWNELCLPQEVIVRMK